VFDWTGAEVVKFDIETIEDVAVPVEDGNRDDFVGDLVDRNFEFSCPVAGRLSEMRVTVQTLSCFWNSFSEMRTEKWPWT
jgi:hypothetical protein